MESDDVESEEISEAFVCCVCCVCLDLLYKPIVLACGHICCFWCVHRSMNSRRESHCPICRHPYHHFPTICQMLHFLLLKMYPAAYKRREDHVLEGEKKIGCFSPKVEELLCGGRSIKEMTQLDDQARSFITSNQENLLANSSTRKGEPHANVEQPDSVAFVQDKEISIGSFETACAAAIEEKGLPNQSYDSFCQQVSIADVLSASCKQLLFRPAVLNCGHVYCKTCIIPTDEVIRCQVCESPHPRGSPTVCLEFDHFLEEQFPKEYAARRVRAQLKEAQFQLESPSTCGTKSTNQGGQIYSPAEDDFFNWWGDHDLKVHIGVGCDSCGMYPIMGDRYICRDCKDEMGFDLCGDCYKTCSKLRGRFNQQHTADHRLVLLNSDAVLYAEPSTGTIRRWISRALFGDASGNLENVLPSSTSSENGSEDPSTSSVTGESQNDESWPAP